MRLPLNTFPLFRKGADVPLFLINSKTNAFPGVTVDSDENSFCIEVDELEVDTDWFNGFESQPTPVVNDDRYDDLHARYLQLLEVYQAQKHLLNEMENLALLNG